MRSPCLCLLLCLIALSSFSCHSSPLSLSLSLYISISLGRAKSSDEQVQYKAALTVGQLASNAVRLMPKMGLGVGLNKQGGEGGNGVGHGAKVMDRLREQVNAQKGKQITQDYLDKSSQRVADKAQLEAEELQRAREEIAALQAADAEVKQLMGDTAPSLPGGGATGMAITRTALQIGSNTGRALPDGPEQGSGRGSGRGNLDATLRIN